VDLPLSTLIVVAYKTNGHIAVIKEHALRKEILSYAPLLLHVDNCESPAHKYVSQLSL
jgi:hypothetical protein